MQGRGGAGSACEVGANKHDYLKEKQLLRPEHWPTIERAWSRWTSNTHDQGRRFFHTRSNLNHGTADSDTGPDTVQLPPSVAGTYTLTAALGRGLPLGRRPAAASRWVCGVPGRAFRRPTISRCPASLRHRHARPSAIWSCTHETRAPVRDLGQKSQIVGRIQGLEIWRDRALVR
jgi:hypothetical protein